MAGKGRTENLKPLNTIDAKEALRIRKLGAEASNKVQKEKKELKKFSELLADTLESEIKSDKIKDLMEENFPNLPKTYKGQFVSSLMRKIKVASILETKDLLKLFEVIRDTVGEKPIDKQKIEQTNANFIITDEKVINKIVDKLKNF